MSFGPGVVSATLQRTLVQSPDRCRDQKAGTDITGNHNDVCKSSVVMTEPDPRDGDRSHQDER